MGVSVILEFWGSVGRDGGFGVGGGWVYMYAIYIYIYIFVILSAWFLVLCVLKGCVYVYVYSDLLTS